jgi:hypothetical protein
MKRLAFAAVFAALIAAAIWRELRRNFAWEEPFEPDTDPYLVDLWRRDAA